jgi:hypothetical protein
VDGRRRRDEVSMNVPIYWGSAAFAVADCGLASTSTHLRRGMARDGFM